MLPGHHLGLRWIGNVRGGHDLYVVFVEHVQHAAMEFGVEPVYVGRFVGVDIQLVVDCVITEGLLKNERSRVAEQTGVRSAAKRSMAST